MNNTKFQILVVVDDDDDTKRPLLVCITDTLLALAFSQKTEDKKINN